MLVAARHERRGLGRHLMTHVLSLVTEPTACLLATEFGRPLYERLGFRRVEGSTRYVGSFTAGPPGGAPAGGAPAAAPREATEADLPAIAALDRAAFGADRSRLLARLAEVAERFVVVDGPAGAGLRGFAASWSPAQPAGAAQPPATRSLGPVVASDQAVATALVTSLAAGSQAPVRLDVPARQAGLGDWAAARGLAAVRESTLMVRGGDLPGAREQVFAPVNMAMC